MAGSNSGAPVIIKRKKIIAGGGHHGGAWKVAYADFVTAMMAFFLLMWLLNATTESQRKGIADYFDPTIPISRVSGGGPDMFAGSSIFAREQLARDGTGGNASDPAAADRKAPKREEELRPDARHEATRWSDPIRQPGEIRHGEPQGKGERVDARGADAAADTSFEEAIAQAVADRLRDRADYQGLDRHLIFRVTDEGLRIEVVDRHGEPMFESGFADATPRMQALLQVIAEVLRDHGNRIALTGHTDAIPFAGSRYGNWELSTDRAHTARRLLERFGIAVTRYQRVEGLADTVPLIADDTADPRNRRIGIVILRSGR